MKRIRLVLVLLAVVMVAASTLFLLNVTAPNPTWRRYSSAVPVLTGQGSRAEIGLSGEMILSSDLGLPRNEEPEQRQCICGQRYSAGNGECNQCFALSQSIANYRRPDFFGDGFIAESKNAQNLPYQGREIEQIGAFAQAAREAGYRLWVYVRVDTEVAPEFARLARSTGGDVVYYFTVPGYVDAVDTAARQVLGAGVVVMGLGLLVGRKRLKRFVVITPSAPKPARTVDPVQKALDQTDAAVDFVAKRRDKLRQKLDEQISRDE